MVARKVAWTGASLMIPCLRAVLLVCLVEFSFILHAADDKPITREKPSPDKIEVFCDFRCPFCARMFVRLFDLAEKDSTRVNIAFNHFRNHDGASELAQYFEAARLLYPKQENKILESLYRFFPLSKPSSFDSFLPALSKSLGLDHLAIVREMNSRDVTLRIEQSERRAVAIGVDRTPMVFIKGTQIENASIYDTATEIANSLALRN